MEGTIHQCLGLSQEDRVCRCHWKDATAPKQQRGVQYRATDAGLSVIEDIGLHICPRRELPATQKGPSRDGHCYLYTVSKFTKRLDANGNQICPKLLEPVDIPPELAGRPASSQLPEQELPPVLENGQGQKNNLSQKSNLSAYANSSGYAY